MNPAHADDHDQELQAQLRELAELLISYYGVRAVSYASLQALKARAQQKTKMTEAWRLLAAAVTEVLRSDSTWNPPLARAAAGASAHEVRRVAPAPRPIERYAPRVAPKVPGIGVR